MKLVKQSPDAPFVSTWLQDEVRVPFSRLVELFGEPGDGDGYKAAFEWHLVSEDGELITIYDYKSSSLYDRDNPTPDAMRAADFDDWHVGGTTKRAAELLRAALRAKVSA